MTTECSVLHCTNPGERSWSTGETDADYSDWAVCRTHHALLRSGVDWATHSGPSTSAKRWIVMGADLADRNTDELHRATVSFEHTGSGKEMEIEVTTGRETFDMILDQQQAAELGEAVADMTTRTPSHEDD